jgi:hypothetical protein
MAVCPKPGCNSTHFKIEHLKPTNATYELPLVVCDRCGTVVAVSPEQTYKMLREIYEKS